MYAPLRTVAGLFLPRACALCGTALLLAPAPSPAGGRASAAAAETDAPLCGPCAATLEAPPGPRCRRCGRVLLAERETCLRCRQADFPFESARSLWPWAGAPARLVAAYKFGNRRSLAPFLARMLAVEAQAFPGAVLVPVPCSPASLRRRGWDQSATLARELSRLGFPARRLLVRGPGKAQKTLDREARKANLAGSIRVMPGPPPERALLLDDVFTTGATLSACAEALLAAGVRRVDALALAHD